MGACGSKNSPLLDDGPPMMPGLKPIEMVPTGSTVDDLVESNILEADDIEDIFPLEREPSSNKLKQEQQQGVGSQRESIDNTTPTASLLQLPNGSPSKIIVATPAESPLATDKILNLKALHNISPPSSSMKLGEGLAKLEVPVKSPRNTKRVSAQEFFSDDLKSMDFDMFESPSSHGHKAISVGSIQEIALKDADAATNKLQRSRASIHTNSTSSYEEIIIESDDDYEIESTLYEMASSGSYVEEVIDDQVFEAFVKAQQESFGRLTFDDFILQQGSEGTKNAESSPTVVEVPPSPSNEESEIDEAPKSLSKIESEIDEPPQPLAKVEIEIDESPQSVAKIESGIDVPPQSLANGERGIDAPPQSLSTVESGIDEPPEPLTKVETEIDESQQSLSVFEGEMDDGKRADMETTKADLASLKVTTDDQSAIATAQTLQTDHETAKQLSETTSMRPMSFLITPQTPISNKVKPHGVFVGMELQVAQMLEESTKDADRFLVSPLASPPQHMGKKITADVPFSPLSQKGLGDNPFRKSTTATKPPKIKDPMKSKSRNQDNDNKIVEGEREKKSHRRISHQSKSRDDQDMSKEHPKHHRRKESGKPRSTTSIGESKGKDSSRSLDKEDKKKPRSSPSIGESKGKDSSRSLDKEDKKKPRSSTSIGESKGKDSSRSLDKEDKNKPRSSKSISVSKGKDSSRSLDKEDKKKPRSSKSISVSKLKDSSRSLDKEKKKKKPSSTMRKDDDGTSSKRSSVTSNSKKKSVEQKQIGNQQRRVAQKESVGSPQSPQSTKSTALALSKEKGVEEGTTDLESKATNRRPSRKIKFQPRTSNRGDETMVVDKKSVESDRTDFVKKMNALRARMDEVVGGSTSDLQSTPMPETQASERGEDKAPGKHKIRRKKDQDKGNLKVETPLAEDPSKVKSKHSSAKKRTSGSGQNATTSSCRPTARGKS